MTNCTELKRLALLATKSKWCTDGDREVMSAESDQLNGGYIIAQCEGPNKQENALFIAAASPAVVLALIAENERLAKLADCWDRLNIANKAIGDSFQVERDQLKAEVARSTEREILQLAEIEALRKDKDRLDALESNFWDVRHSSHPIADTGDSSSSLEIVGHWMDKPFERVIGEDYNENLRAAIDQAMKAPAYPPARPEYEFDEIPDFSPGSGNKARRRAESMGIDYDAAMSKEKPNAQP